MCEKIIKNNKYLSNFTLFKIIFEKDHLKK